MRRLSVSVTTQCLAIFLLMILVIFALQPRIGVTESDAYAYIVGAYSIQQGSGYVNLLGGPLNHFPPGYSWLLSAFADPLQAALMINYLSLGVAVALVYRLARKSEWHWSCALSLVTVLGFGFFRGLATKARPDILTYAVFLAGLSLYTSAVRGWRLLGYLLWSLLVPFKLIAIVFVPAALFVDWLTRKNHDRLGKCYELVLIVFSYLIGVGSVVAFNALTIGQVIPASHGQPSLGALANLVLRFVASIPREFLVFWDGSLQRAPWILGLFFTSLGFAIWSLLTLRPHAQGSQFKSIGMAVLGSSWLLTLVRQFDPGSRLMGYGLISLVLAFRPTRKIPWFLYAIALVVCGVSNSLTVNALGVNAPYYQDLAHELSMIDLPEGTICTNSYHILDIHLRHPSQPVRELESLDACSHFLWVTLWDYDEILTTVWPIAQPGAGWCEVASVHGATLFQRCR